MPGNMIADLLIHTCTVVRGAALLASADPLNPQAGLLSAIDFASPAATTTGVRCRLAPLSAQSQAELATSAAAGTVVATHVMHMTYNSDGGTPATLCDLDAVPHPSVNHRIINVLNAAGTALDTGPFDIINVSNLGGESEVLAVLLKRVS